VRIGEKTRKRRFAKSDQFAPELLNFSDCIRRDRDPEPSGEEGLADVRVIESLERSIARGEAVSLEEPRRARSGRRSIRKRADRPSPVNVDAPH
jgi:hypothetical protein